MSSSIIILAAGSSSRMGKSKQLLPINDEPMLRGAVKKSIATQASHTIVVLGSHEEVHRKIIDDLAASIVVNKNWSLGMGSSLKAGLKHVLFVDPSVEAILIVLCDQPAVTTAYLNAMIASHKKTSAPIIASVYAGSPGVPALISKKFFAELLSMRDEAGAKAIIQNNINEATLIDFPEGAIDLDTPEDYTSFTAKR